MNKYVLTALLCPLLGTPAQAQEPVGPDFHAPGSYDPCPTDTAVAMEARAFVQRNLAAMTIVEVCEAYTQLVAGLNVKLVCKVAGEDGPSRWQFVAYRSLDKRWHLYGATRI